MNQAEALAPESQTETIEATDTVFERKSSLPPHVVALIDEKDTAFQARYNARKLRLGTSHPFAQLMHVIRLQPKTSICQQDAEPISDAC